jgi:hypothetical protein
MAKSESQIQKEILDLLNRLPYTVAWKVMQANERGVPDILCCFCGLFVGIEIKRPGGKLTTIQSIQGGRIARAKGIWMMGESADAVRDFLLTIIATYKSRTSLTHERQLKEIEEALRHV